MCNSCWAFAAAEVYYSARARAGYDRSTHISVQQMLDCVPNKNKNSGPRKGKETQFDCFSGTQSYYILKFLKDHSPELENTYPYRPPAPGALVHSQSDYHNQECLAEYVKRKENQ